MKINIELECTPEEARHFLGLPDVKPMQDEMMAQMHERMRSGFAAMDPEPFVKAMMGGASSIEAFQNLMWKAAGSALDAGFDPSRTSAKTSNKEAK